MSELRLSRGDVVICVLPGDNGKPCAAVVVQSDRFNEAHESIVVCPISSDLTGHDLFRIAMPAFADTGLTNDSEVRVDEIIALQTHP